MVVSLLLLSRVFVYQQFDYNVSHCGSLSDCPHGVYWASCISISKSFLKFGKFSASLFQVSSMYLSSLPSRISRMCSLVCFILFHNSIRFCSVFSLPPPFFCSSNSIASNSMSSHLLTFFLPAQVCWWIPMVQFSVQFCIF